MRQTPGDAGARRSVRTLKLTLAYDGTPFVGWQRQAQGVSIQGLLEEALTRIEGGPVTVVGAGRTDAGVHALGQVASVELTNPIAPPVLLRALNAVLPSEVRLIDVCAVSPPFHARYRAQSKTYRYWIVNGPVATPFEWRYAWHVPERLDVDRMIASAPLFQGEHDFAAFRAAGSAVKTSVRRVHRSVVSLAPLSAEAAAWSFPIERPDVLRLVYEVSASGFLRHMVRAMVGTLVEIATGRRGPEAIEKALKSGNRADAGPTAPACGLCLVRVDYGGGG